MNILDDHPGISIPDASSRERLNYQIRKVVNLERLGGYL